MNIFKKLASKLGMKKLVIMIVSLGVVVIAGISSVVVLLLNKDNADTIQISYETNGGESISADVVDIGETHTLPTPVRAGYVFEGWYLTADYSGEPVTSVVADSNVTYYAKWTQVQTITL